MARDIIHTAAGKPVTIQARLVPKFLWFTASIEALVDGKCVAASGGRFGLFGAEKGSFEGADGHRHELALEWNAFGSGVLRSRRPVLPSLSYSLLVDGKTVAAGAVGLRNWWMMAIGPALLVGCMMFYINRGVSASFSDMQKKLNQSVEQSRER